MNRGTSEGNCADHGTKAFHDVLLHDLIDFLRQVLVGVHLASAPNNEFSLALGVLFFDPLVVFSGQLGKVLHDLDGVLLVFHVVLLNE